MVRKPYFKFLTFIITLSCLSCVSCIHEEIIYILFCVLILHLSVSSSPIGSFGAAGETMHKVESIVKIGIVAL